jgi:hypothetical protein
MEGRTVDEYTVSEMFKVFRSRGLVASGDVIMLPETPESSSSGYLV